MAKNYKEYKSVSEFPLHTQKLNREELEAAYQELRNSYRSLTNSRGQLVRRQSEAKANLVNLQQSLKQATTALERVNAEREQLQKSLVHSVEARKQLQHWGDSVAREVDDLKDQIQATNQLIAEFEAVYEEVGTNENIFSMSRRFWLLLKAARRLLNTDIRDLISKPLPLIEPDPFKSERPEDVNRKLLEDK